MLTINAQTVNCVNAYSANGVSQNSRMSRKAESLPSKFWVRLTEALAEQRLPTSQNGVAVMLEMSQGSVGRWYHGEGLPELDTCADLAIRGKVSVDWLITGRKPKYLISKNPVVSEIIEICEDLDDGGRDRILHAVKGERLLKQAAEIAAAEAAKRRA